VNSGAADGSPTRAESPETVLDDRGIAVHDEDVIHRDPKLITHDLRERRLFALALRLHTRVYRHVAGRFHTYRGAFPSPRGRVRRRTERANLAIGGSADADVATFLTRPALLVAK